MVQSSEIQVQHTTLYIDQFDLPFYGEQSINFTATLMWTGLCSLLHTSQV